MVLKGEAEVLGEKLYTASLVVESMSMEQWWNDSDRGKRSTLTVPSSLEQMPILVPWYRP